MSSSQKISSELQFPMEIYRDQSLIASHTNPSKFVLGSFSLEPTQT